MKKLFAFTIIFLSSVQYSNAQYRNFRQYPYGESQHQFIQHGYGGRSVAPYDSRYLYGVNTGRPRQPYVTPQYFMPGYGYWTPNTPNFGPEYYGAGAYSHFGYQNYDFGTPNGVSTWYNNTLYPSNQLRIGPYLP